MKTYQLLFSAIMATLVLSLFSCQEEETSPDMTDSALISAIQSAAKEAVAMDNLPDSAQATVVVAYEEDIVAESMIAQNLGYQVDMVRKRGADIGYVHTIYFNLTGKQLFAAREIEGREKKEKHEKACFIIVFPYNMTMPDGTLLAFEKEQDLRQIHRWYKNNKEASKRPSFVFPLSLILGKEREITINNSDELRRVMASCADRKEDRPCYIRVFPVSYLMPDGSEITVTQKETKDYHPLRDWFVANPEAEGKPTFIFPITISFGRDQEVTVNSKEELSAITANCQKEKKEEEACFEFVYPLSYTMPDGTNIILTTEETADYHPLRDWYRANAEEKVRPSLVFPVTISYGEDRTVIINDRDALIKAREGC
ncbi:MAG: hypothetical protein ACI93L_001464 [Cyclobacteriaceae bacterium]|jgi:hypothetical protein